MKDVTPARRLGPGQRRGGTPLGSRSSPGGRGGDEWLLAVREPATVREPVVVDLLPLAVVVPLRVAVEERTQPSVHLPLAAFVALLVRPVVVQRVHPPPRRRVVVALPLQPHPEPRRRHPLVRGGAAVRVVRGEVQEVLQAVRPTSRRAGV